MKKILITTSSFGKHDPNMIKSLTDQGFTCVLNPHGRKLTQPEVISLIKEHQPLGMIAGVEPLNRDVLCKAERLKVISRCGIGLDNVDLEAAKDMKIKVANTPDAPTISVAELTVGMILSLLRRIHRSDYSIRKNCWERPMGNLLNKKTVGILGCGRIGMYLAKILTAFGCEVIGFDKVPVKGNDISLVNMETLLERSDIISIHIPYSDENRHIVDMKFFKKMKKGALIINSARGGLIDEEALIEMLASGHIGGAALDCFEQEPYTGPLKDAENVILTCHIGSYALEGRNMMEKQSIENLLEKFND